MTEARTIRDDEELLGLTLWEPWASEIRALMKTIENRDWPPPPRVRDGRAWIAVHAGLHFNEEGAERIAMRHYPLIDVRTKVAEMKAAHAGTKGRIVAVARVAGFLAIPSRMEDPPRHAITADADLLASVSDNELRWFFGKFGWVLRDIVPIHVDATCRGLPKFWTIPHDIEREVRRQATGGTSMWTPRVPPTTPDLFARAR